jgi:hypothetical protein
MHPDKVQGVPRLRSDISSLLSLFSAAQPPRRIIRSSHFLAVYYGCGDASGGGFGSTFTGSGGIEYTYGVWGDDLAGCLSNFRELFNLTESLEDKVSTLSFGHLTHLVSSLESQVALYPACEIYLFTDNAVAEGAFHRGTSSNCRLFDLVLRLKQLELHHGAQLHVIHISGTRMQAQGTDALSWGDLTTGVMCNRDMLQFIPLHLSALDRSPPNTSDTSPLARLWTPPPAVADVALEQLSYSRHKHPDLLHIFICPRLMMHRWRKHLYKLSDVLFNIPAGCRAELWVAEMHKPLVVGLILPFLSVSPWLRRLTSSVLDVENQVRRVWMTPDGDAGHLLRQLWI